MTDTRERILVAATDCVRRWGIRRVSMNDVAQGAGLSRRAVYLHFADRDALVLAVLERTAELQVAAVAPYIKKQATLARQVAEAAVHVHALSPEDLALGLGHRPGESQDAAVRLAHSERVLRTWLAFWSPLVDEAKQRKEVRADLNTAQAAEWIMRVILSLVTVPALTFDPEEPDQVRQFIEDHITKGFAR